MSLEIAGEEYLLFIVNGLVQACREQAIDGNVHATMAHSTISIRNQRNREHQAHEAHVSTVPDSSDVGSATASHSRLSLS